MVDALRASDGRARGVATVRAHVSDDELAELHEAGVRGVRFNYVRRLVDPETDDVLPAASSRRSPPSVGTSSIYFEAADLADEVVLFTSLPTTRRRRPHGPARRHQPVDGEEFDLFLRFMDENPNVWSKVTLSRAPVERARRTTPTSCPFARRSSSASPTACSGEPTGRTRT